LKAGEKGKTSRFKRLFSRSKKDPKKQKKQQQSTVAEAPQKPKKMGRTDIWSEKIDNWWAGTKHKRKETEKKERAAETTRIKILALIFTFVAMALAFSLVPLFPQPLPLLLALLVAFVTWMKPRLGMPVGSIVIGIGMLYHLSAANINFIAYLGDIPYRVAFTAIFMGLFVALPIVFYRYRHAIIIDFGILAALSLANTSTAFLAIPLILTMAVFYKKDAIIAAVYYALITTPMLVIEYFNGFIAKTPASVTEWWKLSGSAPPLFEPLVSTFKAFEMPMESFRLFSANVLSDQIIAQFNTYPDVVGKTLHSAIIQYRDSFPGILLFIVIIVGVVLALMVFGVGFIKRTSLAYGARCLYSLVATLAAGLFFVFLGALQTSLAYTAKVDSSTAMLAAIATLGFTLPISMINYQPKKSATQDMITSKANELKLKLQTVEDQLKIIRSSIPLNVGTPEVKMLLVKDKLDDILYKSQKGYYESTEIDKIFGQLDKGVDAEVNALINELTAMLNEYQIFVNTEYVSWFGRLRDVGLPFKAGMKPHFEPDLSLEERIASIQEVLEAGRILAVEVIDTVTPIYSITRTLYDPHLPKDSEAIAFAKKKLDEKAPWPALSELYVALNNWRKQYGEDIEKSAEYLKNSLQPIINLSASSDKLAPVLGDKMPQILSDAKKATFLKDASGKKPLNVINLITIQDLLDTTIAISKDVFTTLNTALLQQQKDIEDMLPTSNYLWEKNATLNERMDQALEILNSPPSRINEVMENLPRFQNYIEECVQTLAIYNERREFMLNYPMAKIAIEDQRKLKAKLPSGDLPFETKYAAEYLKLYYMRNFSDFDFDKDNNILTKKPYPSHFHF
jgi:hypothetical protein